MGRYQKKLRQAESQREEERLRKVALMRERHGKREDKDRRREAETRLREGE